MPMIQKPYLKLSIFAGILVCFSFSLFAQPRFGGEPVIFSERYATHLEGVFFQQLDLPVPDVESYLQGLDTPAEDLFSLPVPVVLNMQNAGQWIDLPNGDRLWLLKIRANEAEGLAFLFDRFQLPPGARVFMTDADGRQQLGAYTRHSNPSNGRFVTGFIRGEEAMLEYFEPKAQRGQGDISLFRIDYAFDREVLDGGPAFGGRMFGFGAADNCHLNVECPEAEGWEQEWSGVCRIMMVLEEGTGWCSGSLINNTLQDGSPYVLSGFHCQDGYTPFYDMWRFDFNYEGDSCSNPAIEPSFQSLLGCTYRAGRQESDFLLLEALDTVPASYGVYFNGWNRATSAPDSTINFHHPRADIKKVSRDDDAAVIHPQSLTWSNGVTTPANHHFRVKYEFGSFEPGSSGSPLLDENGYIVGQLHGGFTDCISPTTFHGRFSISWDAGATAAERLKDWLDPNDSGVMTLDGYAPSAPDYASVSGRVQTEWGEGVAGVSVSLIGDVDSTLTTDTSGMYGFYNVPLGGNYEIVLSKDYGVTNGVTTLDMVAITKHVLQITDLDSAYKIIASDANHSSSVTTLDLVGIKKVILLIENAFPNNTSWLFVPADYDFPDPMDPFSPPFPEISVINNHSGTISGLDFIGIKVGDVNESVNPGN